MQNPVYMVFACLVADQDLLFCLYDVPCISICRAEQRPKALERLGLPNTVYREIEERGGGHVVAPLPTATATTTASNAAAGDAAAATAVEDPDHRGMDSIWTAIARSNATHANSTHTHHSLQYSLNRNLVLKPTLLSHNTAAPRFAADVPWHPFSFPSVCACSSQYTIAHQERSTQISSRNTPRITSRRSCVVS